MAEYYIEHYGYVDDGHSLAHYGVRGMRWRQHKYTGNSSRDYDYSTGDRSRANYYNVQGQIADTRRFHAQRDPQRIINTRRQNAAHRQKISKIVNTGDLSRADYYSQQPARDVARRMQNDLKKAKWQMSNDRSRNHAEAMLNKWARNTNTKRAENFNKHMGANGSNSKLSTLNREIRVRQLENDPSEKKRLRDRGIDWNMTTSRDGSYDYTTKVDPSRGNTKRKRRR